MSVATMVMPVATYFFKQSLEQIDLFDILHNTIELIDAFN
jgi:hypothetical protein